MPESPILPKGFATGRSVVEPEPVILQPKLSWFQRLRNGLATGFRTLAISDAMIRLTSSPVTSL
ncbi:hypothetical protein ACC699_38300, partial [Rhizobium ruizarguesonis]